MIRDIRDRGVHPQGEVLCVQRRDKSVLQRCRSELDTQLLCCCCINQHQCLYSVLAKEQQKRQWLCLIFKDSMPAKVNVSLFVCANHFTSDCFSNEGQYKAGFASTLTLVKATAPPILDPATAPEPQVMSPRLQLPTSMVK